MLSGSKTDGGLNSDCKRRLERAMLLYLRYPVTSATVPLFPDLKLHPHLQFLDSGLLNHVLRTTGLYFKDEDLSAVFQGCLAEQVVGQELLVLGWWVAIVY